MAAPRRSSARSSCRSRNLRTTDLAQPRKSTGTIGISTPKSGRLPGVATPCGSPTRCCSSTTSCPRRICRTARCLTSRICAMPLRINSSTRWSQVFRRRCRRTRMTQPGGTASSASSRTRSASPVAFRKPWNAITTGDPSVVLRSSARPSSPSSTTPRQKSCSGWYSVPTRCQGCGEL